LIQEAIAGEEVIIAKDNQPVVKLVAISNQKHQRQLGIAKGKMVMSDSFDEVMDDFSAYMP